MEAIKHFERPQFLVIMVHNKMGSLDMEHCYSKEEAVELARHTMTREMHKCQRLFPDTKKKGEWYDHSIHFCEIWDCLNRSSWGIRMDIDVEGMITKKSIHETQHFANK